MTTELAETMESVFAEITGFASEPLPEKGEQAVLFYLREVQKLDRRSSEAQKTYQALCDWFEMRAALFSHQRDVLDNAYLETVKAVTRDKTAGSGKKSHDYFYGVCGFRNQDQYEWPENERELIDWCILYHIPINTKRTIDKAAIKKYIKETGEIPLGVTVMPRVEKFYVKPAPLAVLPESEQPKLLEKGLLN